MLSLSYVVLIIAALYSAVLPYRQTARLHEQVTGAAAMICLACLFIAVSAISGSALLWRGEDEGTLGLMLRNLQLYLAIPLWCTVLATLNWPKYFSKGTWGRWSLVLLAAFELCRRAQVSDYYNMGLAIYGVAAIALTLIFRTQTKLTLIAIAGLLSISAALLVFTAQLELTGFANSIAYNLSLASGLVLLTFHVTRSLALEVKNTRD